MASNPNVELIAALYDEENQNQHISFTRNYWKILCFFETALRYKIPAGVVKRAKEVYGKIKID